MKGDNYNLIIKVGVGLFFGLLFFAPSTLQALAISPDTILQLENEERLKNNLNVLIKNNILLEVAQTRANDMIANNYFAHQSPDGTMAWDIALEKNYNYKFIGENLAMDWKNSGDLVQAWLDSQSHRDNIINSNFFETGIAVAKSATSTIVVQVFGQQFENSLQYQLPAVKTETINQAINEQDFQQNPVLPDLPAVLTIIPNYEYSENRQCPIYPISYNTRNHTSQNILGARPAENSVTPPPAPKSMINYWIFLLMISCFPISIPATLLLGSQSALKALS